MTLTKVIYVSLETTQIRDQIKLTYFFKSIVLLSHQILLKSGDKYT